MSFFAASIGIYQCFNPISEMLIFKHCSLNSRYVYYGSVSIYLKEILHVKVGGFLRLSATLISNNRNRGKFKVSERQKPWVQGTACRPLFYKLMGMKLTKCRFTNAHKVLGSHTLILSWQFDNLHNKQCNSNHKI